MDRVCTPARKFNCLAEAYKLVVDSIDVFSKKKEGTGADDSTPVLAYVLLLSLPAQMMSTIKYDLAVQQVAISTFSEGHR